jgi:hypothetical protein
VLSEKYRSSRGEHVIEWTLFLLVALCCWHAQWLVHGDDPSAFLQGKSDNLGYYQWLPAAFVDGSFDKMAWSHQLESGKWLSMLTFAVALLQLPFFLLGHWFAASMGYPVDGYSAPYAVMTLLGASIYTAAGCVIAYKLAARYAGELAALLSVLVIFSGTNLLYYAVYQPWYSHLYSFFLIGLFCWCSTRLLDGPRPRHVVLWVLSGGLVVLVRQLNIIVLLFLWIPGRSSVVLEEPLATARCVDSEPIGDRRTLCPANALLVSNDR